MFGFLIIVAYSDKFKNYRKLLFVLSAFIALCSGPADLIFKTSCPNCLGDELCESLVNGSISMNWASKVIAIMQPKHAKPVYFGTSDNFGEVVLKSMTERGRIRPRKYKSRENLTESIIRDNVFTRDDKIQSVILCPNVKSIDKLFRPIDRNLENLANTKYQWLDLSISIEPMLLKLWSQVPNLNVPKFYGACGDLTVTEYRGKPLTNYFNFTWKDRLFLAIQILEMADIFTLFHPSFAFYFKDITPDNIVVNNSGAVSLIDLDNVIISERTKPKNYQSARDVHVSIVADPTKMFLSPSDICEHTLSDHNYFSVCKYIFQDTGAEYSGLLKDVPRGELERSPDFLSLLEECGAPKVYANRISAGKNLLRVMKEMYYYTEHMCIVEHP